MKNGGDWSEVEDFCIGLFWAIVTFFALLGLGYLVLLWIETR